MTAGLKIKFLPVHNFFLFRMSRVRVGKPLCIRYEHVLPQLIDQAIDLILAIRSITH